MKYQINAKLICQFVKPAKRLLSRGEDDDKGEGMWPSCVNQCECEFERVRWMQLTDVFRMAITYNIYGQTAHICQPRHVYMCNVGDGAWQTAQCALINCRLQGLATCCRRRQWRRTGQCKTTWKSCQHTHTHTHPSHTHTLVVNWIRQQ